MVSDTRITGADSSGVGSQLKLYLQVLLDSLRIYLYISIDIYMYMYIDTTEGSWIGWKMLNICNAT
jgi:hypothetical protein